MGIPLHGWLETEAHGSRGPSSAMTRLRAEGRLELQPTLYHPHAEPSRTQPFPLRKDPARTCVQGNVSRANDLELQTRQESSPLGVWG